MRNEIKELILVEILEHYINGEQDLMIAYNRASYAFDCYSEEDDERCQEIFGVDSQHIIDAKFDINDIKFSDILNALDEQGIEVYNQ